MLTAILRQKFWRAGLQAFQDLMPHQNDTASTCRGDEYDACDWQMMASCAMWIVDICESPHCIDRETIFLYYSQSEQHLEAIWTSHRVARLARLPPIS